VAEDPVACELLSFCLRYEQGKIQGNWGHLAGDRKNEFALNEEGGGEIAVFQENQSRERTGNKQGNSQRQAVNSSL
jgi:hypothetical protein